VSVDNDIVERGNDSGEGEGVRISTNAVYVPTGVIYQMIG
jgi:hypothetical protein